MAIDTYAKLQAAVADTINRDDLSADVTAFSPAQIDGMIKRSIAYATATLQRNIMARGGHKNMEAVDTSLVLNAETLTLPSDFLGVSIFAIIVGQVTKVLENRDIVQLWSDFPSLATGEPVAYSIVQTRTLYARPVPQTAYASRLIYYAAIPVLDADADDNWLLLNHPDLYVGAAMYELCLYLENDDRLQFWNAYMGDKLDDLMGEDRQKRFGQISSAPTLNVVMP